MIYNNVRFLGKHTVQSKVIIGAPSREYMGQAQDQWPETTVGENAMIRHGTIIYCDVTIGENLETGHNVLIREQSDIGNDVLLGSNTIVDGHTKIGDNVIIQSAVYIPLHTTVENKVFIGPNAILTNDKYPGTDNARLKGPILREGAVIGANATILPGIEIGESAFVAAGALVTKSVPPKKLAVEVPAVIRDLPQKLEK